MSYRTGRSFEYRARDVFREHGYQCDRKAASSPYDLLVQEDGKTLFLAECKKTGKKDYIYVSEPDIEKLLRESKRQNAIPLLLYGFYRTPVFIADPHKIQKTGKMFKLEKGDNRELSDFLKAFKQGRRK
ncbi:MAG: hypothetical protein J7L23_03140 [Candidatus Diapherotrites archaeon]|nr:hypothetical protein [Candidatus Diapherotrites archaeon]